MDALNHFKVMGALAKELGGKEWLEMLHGILHPDGERFAFEWSWLACALRPVRKGFYRAFFLPFR